jgi:hypothetical protein
MRPERDTIKKNNILIVYLKSVYYYNFLNIFYYILSKQAKIISFYILIYCQLSTVQASEVTYVRDVSQRGITDMNKDKISPTL